MVVKTQTPQPSNEPILSRCLREAWEFTRAGRRILATFDLDSTLYDNKLRFAAIFADFAAAPAHVSRFPDECKRLAEVTLHPTDWGLKTPLARAGLDTGGEFFTTLYHFWESHFFSDTYIHHDEPLPGAVDFVQELHQVGAHVMYLSARDFPRMGKGTQESLRQHRFPLILPSARLVLKPRKDLDDANFKLDVLRDAEEEYDRIWLFENEPVNLNLVAHHCPEIGLVFIDSNHSGIEELRPTLDTIKHFEVDIAEFRRRR